MVHEGGYSEVYVPFCGHAIMEALSGHNLVGNPALEIFQGQQLSQKMHDGLKNEMASEHDLV